jgi:16S rRNA (cytosine967-C5)-methyltransferase
MLKPDGILVYSTCSIFPSENEAQIKAFIERNEGQFELLEEKRISPAADGYDGFYMAKLARVKYA